MKNFFNTLKLNKQLLISIFMTIMIYLTLVIQGVVKNYNILSLCIAIILILYINKIDLFDKKNYKITIGLALFLSILTIIGSICLDLKYSETRNLWNEVISTKGIISLIGTFSYLYIILISILPKLDNLKIIKRFHLKPKKRIFYLSFLGILVCYLPYFIINYPGFFSSDSISELEMVASNLSYLSDHHTVIHVLSAYFPYKLGMLIFDNSMIASSMIILTQMIIMSLIFATTINFLYKRHVNKYILILVFAFFAICPIHAFYSITMWKDIIFSGLVLLLTLELIKLLEKKQITIKNSYSFIIVSILTVFFRNNGIYMYIILSLVTIFIFKKQLKVILMMLLIVFSTYYIVKGPIYNYFNIKTSSTSEYIAIPLQQIARMVYKDVKFTKEEEKLINDLMPIETMKKSYNPEILDPIKFHKDYNKDAFEKNKTKYLKLWTTLCIKHFDISTESYFISTLGYWYPDVDYWTVLPQIDKNNLQIERTKLSKKFNNLTELLITKKLPIYGFIWSIGLCVWLILIFGIKTLFSKNKKILYVYVPIIGVWLTTMIATPVYAEFRYVYSLYTTLPILLLAPYLKLKEQ